MKPTLLILAAGVGSRYGSLKQIDRFGPCGETIMDYSIHDAVRAGFGKVVFVIRKDIEKEFRESFSNGFPKEIEVDCALQEIDLVPEGIKVPAGREKPWGTGQAVLAAADKINEPFAVINADDFYGYESFKIMADALQNEAEKSHQILLGYRLSHSLSDHGYVSRGLCEIDEENFLTQLNERTHITKEKDGIFYREGENKISLGADDIVSMNLMGFTPDVFTFFEQDFKAFIDENINELKAEFYLPSVVNNLINSKIKKIKVLYTPEKWFGITYKEDKFEAVKKLRELTDRGLYPYGLHRQKTTEHES